MRREPLTLEEARAWRDAALDLLESTRHQVVGKGRRFLLDELAYWERQVHWIKTGGAT